MGQIIGSAAKPKRCNLSKLSQLGIPAAGEHILVSSDNSMNVAGQGNFDCYIIGDGTTAATALKLKSVDILIGAFDISAYHATGDVLAKYSDLTAALGANGANIPEAFRRGGMFVKFVQSSDNNYVQCRYMGTSTANADFTNINNWQNENALIPLDKEQIADNLTVTDLSSLLTNAGFVFYNNGSIASGTTYPNARYSNPIAVSAGDVIYIKANIPSSISVLTVCNSNGENRCTLYRGAGSLSEFRYVAATDGYIIISTYKVSEIGMYTWLKISNIKDSSIYSRLNNIEIFGNRNVWQTNPSGDYSKLETFSYKTPHTIGKIRRNVYNSILYAKFKGVDATEKRTLYMLWNGYSSKFRLAISKYSGSSWVSEFNFGPIPLSTINPDSNGIIPVKLQSGSASAEFLIDTSLFGSDAGTVGEIFNALGSANEPEFIFSEYCYDSYNNDDVVKVVPQSLTETQKAQARQNIGAMADDKSDKIKIYPNALLPCISFEFDDNADNDSSVVALFDELGVKCNFAFIASEDNILSKGAEYCGYYKKGYGICSHSVDSTIFNTTNYTRETALAALQTSKNRLEALGINVNGFVSPSSQMASDFFDLVEDTYGYAFTENDGYSGQRRGNPCRQSRQSMQSATLDYLKGRVDVAITFGYNFTFYGHSADFGTTTAGEEWNLTKLRAIVEYAIAKRDAGQIFIGNSDECMSYFYGEHLYNRHFFGACGIIQPKNRHHYYLHNVTSATIAYSANLPAECDIYLETDSSYTSGITFGSGYKFASVPTFGAGETWYLKIVQGCVIATKMV